MSDRDVWNFLQGANRGAVAGMLGSPVDAMAALLNIGIAGAGYAGHRTGLLKEPIPLLDEPVGGSEWIAAKMRSAGLLTDAPGTKADTAGAVAGGLLSALASAGAPQVAALANRAKTNAAAPRALHPQKGALVLGHADDAARKARMEAMGMERGWYRGGPAIDKSGRRSGPWYTQDADEAAGYMRPGGEVREYAIPRDGFLEAHKPYSHKLPHDVARILDDPYYGKPGAQLAKELRTFGPDEGVTGGQLWQALESRFGNDGAAEVLTRLGAFKGAKGITRADEAYVFKGYPVRDANTAAFNKDRAAVDDIYGGATLPALGLLAGTSLGGSYLGRRERSGQAPGGKK